MFDTMQKKIGKRFLVLFIVCSFATVVLYRKLVMEVNDNVKGHILHVDSMPSLTHNNTCLKTYFKRGIDKLNYNINVLFRFSNTDCSSVYEKFSALYEVNVVTAAQNLGLEFRKKMKTWLGGNQAMLELAESQTIFVVHDKLMQRTTVFNPLRSKRPVSESQNSLTYLKNISESSKRNCDFCNPFNMTARDIFGRIQGKYSVSASNAFKLGKWHGLFIPYTHSIFDIDIDIFLDLFNVSLKWFKKVHSIDINAKYPVLFWDTFPHAGASQMHVHVHGIVGERNYPGQFQDVLSNIRTFQQAQNSHYWDSVVQIHETLGLALRFGKTIALAPLVPKREHELWLLSNEPSSEFFILLYSVIRMYQEKMGRYCFSMASAMPLLGKKVTDPEESLPCVILIGTRGDCSSSVSDVSSLELYLFNTVNTDPYDTIETLKQHLAQQSSKYKKAREGMESLWDDASAQGV